MPPKILLITPASPFTPCSGAEQRTALLYEGLVRSGHVDVLLLEAGPASAVEISADPRIVAKARWHNLPLGIAKYRPDRQLSRQVNNCVPLTEYDLIVGRYLSPICKLILPHGTRTLVDLDDWGYHYGGHARWTLKGMFLHAKSAYARMLARWQLKRFDAFFFVSERDKNTEPGVCSEVLPNIPFSPPAQPFPQTDSKKILFVGALWYGPNRQGIEHFLIHCWDNIRKSVPEATFTLVGAAPPDIRAAWEKYPGVQAPGFVENLDEAYREAAFTIAPIYFGGGTNIKVLESLAYGRACVTTPHCANAFSPNLVELGGISAPSSDTDFASLCVKFLRDPSVRQKQATAGHHFVSKACAREQFFSIVQATVEQRPHLV